jgi:hypothetical protein
METKKRIDSQYKTALVIIVGFVFVFVITSLKWILIATLIVGVISLISEKFLNILIFLWDKLSLVLSKIIPNLFLSIIFYLFLTPIALLSKIFSKRDQLNLKNNTSSLFVNYKKDISKIDFEKPW